jgi:SAM-dependent methyltransferase
MDIILFALLDGIVVQMNEIFGYTLSEYYYKGSCPELIIERDDGYLSVEDVSRYFQESHEWPKIERLAITHARGRVLDLGCGAGRHSLYLIGKGLEVYSIDILYEVLKIARARGVENPILSDINKLYEFRENTFDTILLLSGGFGLAGNISNIETLLHRLHSITSDEGIIIGSSLDPFRTRNEKHIRYHERNRELGIYEGTVKIRFVYKGRKGEWFLFTHIDPVMLKSLCSRTGWKMIKQYDEGPIYSFILSKK